ARFPTMVAYAYQAKKHYYDHDSLYLHSPRPDYDTAENLLHMIRRDNLFTKLESDTLDLMLVIHAEHGGGNNSAFTTHVVSSTGTDTYSALSAAVGSLKGPKHGGANAKVMGMIDEIKENCNWKDQDSLKDYLVKILNKEAYDKTGLIYGMGHAVYTLSDPRAKLLKKKALELAESTGMMDEFTMYDRIEKISPEIYNAAKGTNKELCANVDFYSGFVYNMLNIPPELYTPLFAVSRVSGWCAHRMEEVMTGGKIIRPAYKSISKKREYIPQEDR
ncbi:MAG: citrate synthase, partial [Bacillota bacterium]|nr:citrate synthase [Bacillota bacterium]